MSITADPAAVLWWVRAVSLLVYVPLYLVFTVGVSFARPQSEYEIRLQAQARKRYGQLGLTVAMTVQHLTMCSLGLLCVYLALVLWPGQASDVAAGRLAIILVPLQGAVGIMYWALTLYDPWLIFPRELFPKDDTLSNRVVREMTVFPAFNHRVIVFMWIVLHLQHTTAPLHAWGEAALGVIPQVASPTLAAELSWVFLAMLVYLGFNMFAWRVRSVAPYPVQQRVHDKGPATTAAFYVLNVAVVWMMVLAVRCLRDDSNDFGSSDNYIRGATI